MRVPDPDFHDSSGDRVGPTAPQDVEAAWIEAMRQGDWEAGWALSDRVLRAREPADFDRPWTPFHTRCVWDGSPLAGRRVLIRCYHGLGDTIQFVRYGATLRRMTCTVMLEAQPELLPLLRRCPWVETAVPLGDADGLGFDVAIESMELPHALRTRPTTVPVEVPYLDPGTAFPFSKVRRETNVGLVWRTGDWDRRRSMDLPEIAPLLQVPGIVFHSLQLGADRASLKRHGIVDLADRDILELAARLRSLDLIVTVDTMVAHLAGALGRPVWTLLHAAPDWRWGCGGTTPWYPTMRLFRQSRPGDWAPPVALAAKELADWRSAREGDYVPGP